MKNKTLGAIRAAQYRASLTPEQREAMRLKAKAKRDAWTPEERKRRNAKHRQWKANLSPERLANYKTGRHQYAKNQRETRPEFFAEQDRKDYAARQLRLNSGLCTMTRSCPYPVAGTTRLCLKHWIMTIAAAANRRNNPHKVHHSEILELWHKQHETCAVTRLKLVPGVNAHLDHIVPIGRNGTHELSNLRFVHETFNRMKDDRLDSELKEFLKAALPALHAW